jgi:hypothetical protein
VFFGVRPCTCVGEGGAGVVRDCSQLAEMVGLRQVCGWEGDAVKGLQEGAGKVVEVGHSGVEAGREAAERVVAGGLLLFDVFVRSCTCVGKGGAGDRGFCCCR